MNKKKKIKAEKRELKKRQKMKVSGKSVFQIKKIAEKRGRKNT